jgi:Arc/MetJ-type ribon-helix-helix transcriptional regulator
MIRTQIQLTEEQARLVRQVAASRSVSMAELIRDAIEDLVAKEHRPSRDDVRRRAMDAAGRFRVDVEDLSTRHDDYLAEALEGEA